MALSPWVRPLAYCENDRYAQSVLLCRMQTGDVPNAPVWDEVRTLRGSFLPSLDIIYGGFPCQDISVAGNGAGLEGKRSGLFFEILRLVDELSPKFIFLENVPAIRTRGAERVGKELSRRGYDCRWDVISAHEVGAPHLRKRWFLLAHSNGERRGREDFSRKNLEFNLRKPSQLRDGTGKAKPQVGGDVSHSQRQRLRNESRRSSGPQGKSSPITRYDGGEEFVADTASLGRGKGRAESTGLKRRLGASGSGSPLADSASKPEREQGHKKVPLTDQRHTRENPSRRGWWATEPDVGRVVNGLPFRVDRLRGLGNAVVPSQAQEAFKRLMGIR